MIRADATLTSLSRALGGLSAGADAEKAVHDVRTSCRRLDVFLRLAGLHVFRDDLRWLSKSLADVRDADVVLALDFEGAASFKAALARRRRGLLEAARGLATAARTEALVHGLSLLRGIPERAAARRAAGLERRAAAAWERSLEGLHSHRRAVRRARYAREWLGLDAEQLRAEQELLGSVCDLACLRAQLEHARLPLAVEVVSAGITLGVELLSR